MTLKTLLEELIMRTGTSRQFISQELLGNKTQRTLEDMIMRDSCSLSTLKAICLGLEYEIWIVNPGKVSLGLESPIVLAANDLKEK